MNTLKRSALTALAYSAVCSLTSWTYLVLDAYGHTNDLDFFVWIGVLIIMALAYPFVEKRLIGEDPGSGESLQFGALFFALSIPLSLLNVAIGSGFIFNVVYPESARHAFLAGIEFMIAAMFHEIMFAAAVVIRLIWALIGNVVRRSF